MWDNCKKMNSKPLIYLAPFQGITTYTYREVYTKHFGGVDKLFTPFFTGIQKPNSLAKRAFEFNFPTQNKVEVIPQMLSKDADEITRFANFCEKKGFNEVNWNLGCPYPRVANKKRGSGMLPYPDMVGEILNIVMPNISNKFSIKCRLGYFSEDEIISLMKVYNSFNISELTIHARIGKQLYTGDVNIEAFERAVAISNIPIVYNGDIFTIEDFHKFNEGLLEINNWMIGRGILVDPFLPMKIKGQVDSNIVEQGERVYKFITDLYLAYRKKNNDRLQAIGAIKELWSYLAYSFNDPHKVLNSIKKTSSFDKYEEAVAYVFKEFDWLGSEGRLYEKKSRSHNL